MVKLTYSGYHAPGMGLRWRHQRRLTRSVGKPELERTKVSSSAGGNQIQNGLIPGNNKRAKEERGWH